MEERRNINDDLLSRLVNNELTDEDRNILDEWELQSKENESLVQDIEKIAADCEQLAVMSRINSSDALLKVKYRIKRTTALSQFVKIWQKVAAIIILPLIALSLYQFFNIDSSKKSISVSWNEVSTPYGLMSKIMLPDSTVVELNGLSKLRYPNVFTGNERLVELDGEAFFNVKTNRDKPFVVNCSSLEIQAVGTSFNVLELETGEVITALLDGKVNLFKKTANGKQQLANMAPGQTIEYNTLIDKITNDEKGSVDKYIAWREGKLIFRNDPLPDVLNQLSRVFNVNFEVDNEVDNRYAYTGTFVHKNLDQILNYIKLTTPVVFDTVSAKSDEKAIIKVKNK